MPRYVNLEIPELDDWAVIWRAGKDGYGAGNVVHCVGVARCCAVCLGKGESGCIAACYVIQFLGDLGFRYDPLGYPAVWPSQALFRLGPDDPSKCRAPDGKRLRDNKK